MECGLWDFSFSAPDPLQLLAVPPYPPTRFLRGVRYWYSIWYTMSGTRAGYGAMSLRACYAMSATNLAYAPTTGRPDLPPAVPWRLRLGRSIPFSYALRPIFYALATRCVVLTFAMLLPELQYRHCGLLPVL
eukprot:3940411-Rhodomonas_salina.4